MAQKARQQADNIVQCRSGDDCNKSNASAWGLHVRSCVNVSRMGFHCCWKHRLHCRRQQRKPLAKSDHITNSKPTQEKEPWINPGSSAQARTGATAIKTTSDVVDNASNATAQHILFTEKFTKQPFLVFPKPLPHSYEHASPLDLTNILSSWLSKYLYNDKLRVRNNELTWFHSKAVPQISVREYLQRLARYAALSTPILLSMMVYLQRLRNKHPALKISSLNVHRLLLACSTVASKFVSDCFWTNQIYAQIGGVRARELTRLESRLLQDLAWDIVPHTKQLEELYFCLVEGHERYFLEP